VTAGEEPEQCDFELCVWGDQGGMRDVASEAVTRPNIEPEGPQC
jgi:hypothetical protein